MKAALLFDLDGTIVDTDDDHLKAFQKVFARHGVPLDRATYRAGIMGAANHAIGERFLTHLPERARAEILDSKEALYRDGIGALSPVSGLLELFDHADESGYARALVTNAPRANVERVLDSLGIADRLPVRVLGPECARPKPDPMPYVVGLERLGAAAERSVAFEDSLSGMRSALGAGLAVIALTTGLDAGALLEAGASLAVADFTDPRIRPFIAERARGFSP